MEATTKNKKTMKGTIYQLLDSVGEQVGLLYTPHNAFNTSDLEKDWTEFSNCDTEDPDDFVDWLNNRYPNGEFQRIFVEELNVIS